MGWNTVGKYAVAGAQLGISALPKLYAGAKIIGGSAIVAGSLWAANKTIGAGIALAEQAGDVAAKDMRQIKDAVGLPLSSNEQRAAVIDNAADALEQAKKEAAFFAGYGYTPNSGYTNHDVLKYLLLQQPRVDSRGATQNPSQPVIIMPTGSSSPAGGFDIGGIVPILAIGALGIGAIYLLGKRK